MSLLPSTSAAGWASQVGYQKELISRRVTRPGAAVETVERWGLQKQRTHHVSGSSFTGTIVPPWATL